MLLDKHVAAWIAVLGDSCEQWIRATIYIFLPKIRSPFVVFAPFHFFILCVLNDNCLLPTELYAGPDRCLQTCNAISQEQTQKSKMIYQMFRILRDKQERKLEQAKTQLNSQ
jgi:hypothetical protein